MKPKLRLIILSVAVVLLLAGAGFILWQNRGTFQPGLSSSAESDQKLADVTTEEIPATEPTHDADLADQSENPSLAEGSDAAPNSSEPDADQVWEQVATDNLTSLRAFLQEFGESEHAPEARSLIQRLDDAAWERVSASDGHAARIAAAEEYIERFPDGTRTTEANQLLASDEEDTAEASTVNHPPPGADTNQTIDPPIETADADEISETPPVDASAKEDVRPETTVATPFQDCPVCPQVIAVPVGEFLMGDVSGDGDADELPVHKVSIGGSVAIGVHEVTFDEWGACVADGACSYEPDDMGWGRGRRPVINVSASDTDSYLTWLSGKTGYRYRLPSEAEWEYAARAGNFESYVGRTEADICQYANAADASSKYRWRNQLCEDGFPDRSAPAGSFTANAFGLHDMMGNVWEWTADCWHDGYGASPTDGGAWTENCDKPDHILRGGAFSVDQTKLRVSYRYSYSDKRLPFFGFRVVRENP
ncbi:hypothetical protein HY17_19140 [Hyphomonas sp. CY54-11-8]|nr:hypothetical protein HY17_19140 [Hyphomonas sp. CY54-11-8]